MPESREQFLDVHQTARVPLISYSLAAVAEHPPGDRHLGVLDRQRAVGVVDRERDLGAAERGPTGRAGEDDVLHLAAAQRLRALLADHPGDGVDHVRLARSVRAHDARDARLEAQRRRRREGLETLQGQTLEVHDVPHDRRASQCSVNPESESPTSTNPRTLRRRGRLFRRPAAGQAAFRRPPADPARLPDATIGPVRGVSGQPEFQCARPRPPSEPTPWTWPCTHAVSRTSANSCISNLNVTLVPDFSVRPTVHTWSIARSTTVSTRALRPQAATRDRVRFCSSIRG